ncbi:hypothetical protein PVAND_017303 [Polypedilum vanderplanki]|uniref:Uncharacterized protein n=1 Tax=Polypedilum vanderplanki TaxID=319348 RepID=A0A9J6BIB4_POLVA|nr:hypothetical protein PVAND_017303 [Polypedilum vanderplanki]
MQNLENLIIHNVYLTKNDIGKIHLKNLKFLNIQRSGIDILDHIKIADNKLEKLILRPVDNFFDFKKSNQNFLENQKNVKILNLQFDASNLKMIEKFHENSQFEDLTYDVVSIEETKSLVNFLKNQKNLKRLKIDCCENLTNEHFEMIQNLNLISLRLDNFDGIDEAELRQILKMTELKQLSLKVNDGNEEAFEIFHEFFLPKLEEFYLNENDVIFDHSYYAGISNCMPNLKTFVILDSGFYEDEVKYAEIFRNFNKVEILSLNNSSLPKVIFEIDEIKNENLKELKISHFYHYEVFEFQKIVENFPNLEKISFEFTVKKFENAKDLKASILENYFCLLSGLKNLKFFNCSTIFSNDFLAVSFTSDDIEILLENSKNLEFFLNKNIKIENFDEIKRNFGQKFDYVKLVDDKILFCNKRSLKEIKNREKQSMWIFHEVVNILGEFFFKSFVWKYYN